ncbi:hypothetical protein U1Q18_028968 [Sarracenia purpurea var. burkii]
MMRRQDQRSRVFYELSALILNIIRSPPSPIQFPDQPPATPWDAADLSGRICFAAFGHFAVSDVMWIGYVFYRIHVDALGSRIGDVFLCRWDCHEFIDAGTRNSLSHHVTDLPKEGGSR